MSKWLRVRFLSSSVDDCRPIYNDENPEGPWWCSGYSENNAVIVAYVKSEDTILKQWPEAENIEIETIEKPTFSDRFPKPKWWKHE